MYLHIAGVEGADDVDLGVLVVLVVHIDDVVCVVNTKSENVYRFYLAMDRVVTNGRRLSGNNYKVIRHSYRIS